MVRFDTHPLCGKGFRKRAFRSSAKVGAEDDASDDSDGELLKRWEAETEACQNLPEAASVELFKPPATAASFDALA